MQEVFAGFLEHIDAQIGRLVGAIEQMGLRDNTLIIYVVGDNGPSAEGVHSCESASPWLKTSSIATE
jgi:arylsulfatase A-like enzyme